MTHETGQKFSSQDDNIKIAVFHGMLVCSFILVYWTIRYLCFDSIVSLGQFNDPTGVQGAYEGLLSFFIFFPMVAGSLVCGLCIWGKIIRLVPAAFIGFIIHALLMLFDVPLLLSLVNIPII